MISMIPEWLPSTWSQVASAATVLAVAVGGFWTYLLFVRGRQKWPQAELTHEFDVIPLDDSQCLVNAKVGIKNVGKRLITVERVKTRIQRIRPETRLVRQQISSYRDSGRAKVRWPEIAQRTLLFSERRMEIEPGETDWLEIDYVLPSDIEIVRFYCFVENSAKQGRMRDRGKQSLGWPASSIITITEQEAPQLERKEDKSMPQAITESTMRQDPVAADWDERQQELEEEPPQDDRESFEEQQQEEEQPPRENGEDAD